MVPVNRLGLWSILWSRNIAFDAVLVGMLVLRAFLNGSNAVRSFFFRMAAFLTLSGLADSYSLNLKNNVVSGIGLILFGPFSSRFPF